MLYSHPGKLLIDHLSEVAINCKRFISERTLFVNNPLKKAGVHDLAYLSGAFHDLGKGTFVFSTLLIK